MLILLTVIHVIICFFLIVVVLLQSGKAADLAGAFGGMGSQTAFGPRGAATLLSKATTIAAVLFMVNSIALGVMHSRQQGTGQSVLERTGTTTTETVPLSPIEQPATTPAGEQPAAGEETAAPAASQPAGTEGQDEPAPPSTPQP